jgi:hypothetical protein
MLAGLQDEFEGVTAVGGEHKDKGEACIHSIEGAANSDNTVKHVSDVLYVIPLYALIHFTKNQAAGGLRDAMALLLLFWFQVTCQKLFSSNCVYLDTSLIVAHCN